MLWEPITLTVVTLSLSLPVCRTLYVVKLMNEMTHFYKKGDPYLDGSPELRGKRTRQVPVTLSQVLCRGREPTRFIIAT